MSYNIIPKNTFKFDIQFSIKDVKNLTLFNNREPYLSHSLFIFLNDILCQINEIEKDDYFTFNNILKIINPYQFLYTVVPNYEVSVSKVKTESTIFFDLIEIVQSSGLNDFFSSEINKIFGHFTKENNSTEYFINMIREDYNDIHHYIDINNIFLLYKNIKQEMLSETPIIYDCLIMEIDHNLNNSNLYLFYLLLYLLSIIRFQSKGGISIIKISYLFYKSIIDIIYILSCIYDKVQFIKPNVNNIIYPEIYLVCKNKLFDPLNNINNCNDNLFLYELEKNIHLLFLILTNENIENININSIIQLNGNINCLPYCFINKIEELNSIYGQQHLEILDQIINTYKNKTRDEKLELIKKNHIQKCIQWCEKNELPHNKFFEKNVFLYNSINDNIDIK
jgi:hypothetical protein